MSGRRTSIVPGSSRPGQQRSTTTLRSDESIYYAMLFGRGDIQKTGIIPVTVVRKLFVLTKLPASTLRDVWTLSSKNQPVERCLNRAGFYLALRLIALAQYRQALNPQTALARTDIPLPYFAGVPVPQNSGLVVVLPPILQANTVTETKQSPATTPPKTTPTSTTTTTPDVSVKPANEVKAPPQDKPKPSSTSKSHSHSHVSPAEWKFVCREFSQLHGGGGYVSLQAAREYLKRSKVQQDSLQRAVSISDVTHDGRLDIYEFSTAFHLLVMAHKDGAVVPNACPVSLHPDGIRSCYTAPQNVLPPRETPVKQSPTAQSPAQPVSTAQSSSQPQSGATGDKDDVFGIARSPSPPPLTWKNAIVSAPTAPQQPATQSAPVTATATAGPGASEGPTGTSTTTSTAPPEGHDTATQLTDQHSTLQGQVQEVERQALALSSQTREGSEHVRQLKREVARLRMRLETRSDALQVLRKDHAQQQSQVQQLQAEKQEKQKAADALDAEVDELRTRIKGFDQQREELVAQLRAEQDRQDHGTEAVAQAEGELAVAQQEHQRSEEALQAARDAMSGSAKRISELEQQRDALQTQIAEARQTLQGATARRDALAEQVREAQHTLKQLRKDCQQEFGTDFDAFSEERTPAEQGVREQITRLMTQLQHLQEQVAAAEAEEDGAEEKSDSPESPVNLLAEQLETVQNASATELNEIIAQILSKPESKTDCDLSSYDSFLEKARSGKSKGLWMLETDAFTDNFTNEAVPSDDPFADSDPFA